MAAAPAPPPPSAASADPTEASIGRAVTRGAIGGFVGIGGLVALGSAAAGLEPGSALGFGAFVGSWGSAGFGAMLGGVIGFTRHLEAERAA